jgi:septal ring factor EnvC (AmiA/AmiB activator)
MIPKTSPEVSGAIRARLNDLRNRKATLDEAIASLERYAAYSRPPGAAAARRSAKVMQMKGDTRWTGAA